MLIGVLIQHLLIVEVVVRVVKHIGVLDQVLLHLLLVGLVYLQRELY